MSMDLKIKFNTLSKLKIMHITDTHLEDNHNLNSVTWMIGKACDREKPDLVIITGDNVLNYDNPQKTKGIINSLMNIFESRHIPVAVTFGNHDSEQGALSRRELLSYYNTFTCSVSVDNGDLFEHCSTYNIPIFSFDGEKIKFNLWIFDSGDYDEQKRYDCVQPDQIEWYEKTSEKLKNENGGEIVPSLAFQHIIVSEIYDVLKKVKYPRPYAVRHLYNRNDYYTFDPKQKNYGTLKEYPCPGYYNCGQFDAMLKNGDVLAVFTGHDHTNGFGVRYKGIDIYTSLATQYRGTCNSTQYGYRIIEVDENDTTTYKTRVVRWCDLFNSEYAKTEKQKGETQTYKLARKLAFQGKIQKNASNIYRVIVEKISSRKVTYPD